MGVSTDVEAASDVLEAVPVPHDDPLGVIPDPSDAPVVEDSLVDPEFTDPYDIDDPDAGGEHDEPVDSEDDVDSGEPHTQNDVSTGPDVPADGGTPQDRLQVQEYSTKTTDVTGKPALNAEDLDELNSMLGTATFSFGDTTYDVVRIGGSWYIKGEKPEEGEDGDGDGSDSGNAGPPGAGGEADSDEAPGEADNESPAEAEEGDEEAEEEAEDDPDDGEGEDDESIDGETDDAPGDAGGSDETEEPEEVEGAGAADRILSQGDQFFNGQPTTPSLDGVGPGLTEESIRPALEPGFAIERDRLFRAEDGPRGDNSDELPIGEEMPSQVGVEAPGITNARTRSVFAGAEVEALRDSLKFLRAHYSKT